MQRHAGAAIAQGAERSKLVHDEVAVADRRPFRRLVGAFDWVEVFGRAGVPATERGLEAVLEAVEAAIEPMLPVAVKPVDVPSNLRRSNMTVSDCEPAFVMARPD